MEDISLQAVNVFNKYAATYQEKFMDVSLYGEALNLFCDHIPQPTSNILDLACGPGNIAKYLLTQKPGLLIRGIDLAPNMIELARTNNPEASFDVMDCRTIATITEKFDGIMCAFCLPYLSMEEMGQLITDINSLLKAKGICYISTMENDHSKSGYETGSNGDQIFMHYYEEADLTNELRKKNFEIVDISRKRSTMGNGKQVVDLIIISQKKNL